MVDQNTQQAIDFFDHWFSGCKGVTSIGGKSGPFTFPDIGKKYTGAMLVREINGMPDIYFRLCPMPTSPGRGRGDAGMTHQLPGFWLDIDVGEKDNGKAYFPLKSEAYDWARDTFGSLGLCAIVDSGHGLHAYLKADEVSIFDEEEAKNAVEMSRRFQYWASTRCPYQLDMTHDLARVLRAPSSFNGEDLVQVVYFDPGRTFSMSDLMDMIPENTKPNTGTVLGLDNCETHPQHDVNSSLVAKLEVARDNDQSFRRMWSGNYSSLKDQSPSGYCMALANRMNYLRFEPSEIRAALFVWREKMGASPKPAGWYDRTVSKAVERGQNKRALSTSSDDEESIEMTDKIEMIEKAQTGDDRSKALDMLSALLGNRVIDFIERRPPATAERRGESTYTIKFENLEAAIDLTLTQLMNTDVIINKVFSESRQFPPLKTDFAKKSKRNERWYAAINRAMLVATIQEGYCSDSMTGLVMELIEDFVLSQLVVRPPAETPNGMKDNQLCFIDGRLAFKRRGLTALMNDEDVKIGRKELSGAFASLGIEHRRFTRGCLWALPQEWTDALLNE